MGDYYRFNISSTKNGGFSAFCKKTQERFEAPTKGLLWDKIRACEKYGVNRHYSRRNKWVATNVLKD